MQTVVLPFSDEKSRDAALRLLRGDGVIVAPTDTVYGIMCRYDSQAAIARLYQIKQRPTRKPIAVLIGERRQLPLVARTPIPIVAETLAARFWPGPLTIILPAGDGLPPVLTAGGSTVGVRMPDHAALRDLIRRAGPVAATSANRSGDPEARTAQEALEQLADLVPLILTDDDIPSRPHQPLASTVVDLTGPQPAVIRSGPIADQVLAALDLSDHSSC